MGGFFFWKFHNPLHTHTSQNSGLNTDQKTSVEPMKITLFTLSPHICGFVLVNSKAN